MRHLVGPDVAPLGKPLLAGGTLERLDARVSAFMGAKIAELRELLAAVGEFAYLLWVRGNLTPGRAIVHACSLLT